MIELRPARSDELTAFRDMEQHPEAERFVAAEELAVHRERFQRPETRYLSILTEGRLVGFILLLLDADGESVDFKRIVLAERGGGLGQVAIATMEEFCGSALGRTRIWLNVFEDNARGRHIYEKLGYREFRTEPFEGRTLHYYEKRLPFV